MTNAITKGSFEASIEPFQATRLPSLPDEAALNDALRALIIACNGSVYHGPALEAVIMTVKQLRLRPDIAQALDIGVPSDVDVEA